MRWLYQRPEGWAPVAAFGAPKPPDPPPPQPIPDAQDPALLADQQRQQAAKANSGRLSTMLAGDDYTRDRLGLR